MNLHEYQSKALFTQYGISVPENRVVNEQSQVNESLKALGGDRWVVKAQVHAGGRGKAGGVKLSDKKDEVAHYVGEMLGTNLVTYQTDAQGQPIHHVLIEETCNIEQELYLGAVVDRATQGGALFCHFHTTGTITGCTFAHNWGPTGGGIFLHASSSAAMK